MCKRVMGLFDVAFAKVNFFKFLSVFLLFLHHVKFVVSEFGHVLVSVA